MGYPLHQPQSDSIFWTSHSQPAQFMPVDSFEVRSGAFGHRRPDEIERRDEAGGDDC